ncbi:MAG: M4 family metallopeptidase [Anaerolineae bacterium]|nr:M4 family metallopeptidase [Anaerolineae bacterium]
MEITWNPLTDTPSFIRGRIPLSAIGLTTESKPATIALALADRYANLFGIKQASRELNIVEDEVDTLGMRHVTLAQVYEGVEVYNAYMKVHLSADSQEVVAVSSGFVPNIRLTDTQPRISADQALAVARKELPNGNLLSESRLVVYPGAGEGSPGASARLAWMVELRDDSVPARNVYFVDAMTGSMVDVLPRLYDIVEELSLEELTERASTILIGQVLSQTSRWNSDKTLIVTDVSIAVEGSIKGLSPDRFVLEVPGGVVDDRRLIVSDTPTFFAGETVILFLRGPDFPGFRLVGWRQGEFAVHNGFVVQEGEQPIHVEEFVGRIRRIMGESGPLPPDLVTLVSRLAARTKGTDGVNLQAVVITRITPDNGPAHADQLDSSGCASDSTRITISGSGFGSTQGASYVRFWQEGSTYYNACVESSWSDIQIVARVPGRVSSGNVVVVVGGVTSNAKSFTVTYSYGGGKWPAGGYPQPMSEQYFVNPNTGDIPGTDELYAVLAAAATWNAAGANFQFRYDKTIDMTGAADDEANVISWVNYDTGSIATNYAWADVSDLHRITGFDIVFNDFSFAWDTDGSALKMDVQNTATHELGHSLMLLDLYGDDDSDKTMYGRIGTWSSIVGETKQRTLESDDIAGIRYIYGTSHSCPTGQFLVEFYDNRAFTGNSTSWLCERSPIHYYWGTGGPGQGVGNDNFSVRWTGQFTFSQDTYTFVAVADDGVKVWVDGSLLIDAWHDNLLPLVREYKETRAISAGQHEVKVEYYEHTEKAAAHLRWTGQNTDPDDNRVISFGDTLWGGLEPVLDEDQYFFDVTGADVGKYVRISVQKSSLTQQLENFAVTLRRPDGQLVAGKFQIQSVAVMTATLSQSGRYTIMVGMSDKTGVYGLRLGLPEPVAGRNRDTYDADHTFSLPGRLARTEGQGPTGDRDIDNAHDFAGATYDYFKNTHNRNSYDGGGATMISTANYGRSYQNAYWNGEQTVYGDDFPVKDVVAHEWTHAVTEHSANLEYRWQSGALNESFSDIFGAMVDRDDWLMGEDLPPHVLGGREAIRDLSNPPRFGQPDHTHDWVETCSDNEGVHTNSGITNKAYYNIATAIGKDKAERIFYRALTVYLDTNSSLEDARAAALQSAQDLYGAASAEYNAVRDGFNAVGLDGQWNPPSNDCYCGASVALAAEPDGQDLLNNLRAVRDQVFTQDPGRRWVNIYYEHQLEVAWLLISDAQLRADAQAGFRAFDPVFGALLAGDEASSNVILTRETIQAAERALMGVAEKGSPAVREDIVREWERINPYRFVGWDVARVKQQLLAEEALHRIYLPLVVK